jgi:FdhD protein
VSEGVVKASWLEYRDHWLNVDSEIIEEALLMISVNGEELASILATPKEQGELALGFLRNEGLIDDLDEVETFHVSDDGCCVDVWLKRPIRNLDRPIMTSGCGRGMTYDHPEADIGPIQEDLQLEPSLLFELLNQLHLPGSLHARARGVHTAGLADDKRVLAVAEDVGRHNAIDKLRGKCMLEGIETRGKSLLTTGRVSSEMLRKGVRMGCPILASRNSPTSMAVAMARKLNVTLVGYVRRNSMFVYAHPQRLGHAAREEPSGQGI